MTKQRMARISLVGIVIFGLLLSGQIIYKNNWIDGQLAKNSRQISGVQSAQVMSENGLQVLEVTTNHIQNLSNVSQQLENIAGKRPIRFKDQRNAELEKVFSQMEFPLQEGITRGNFTQMEQTLQQQAVQAGMTLNITMDSDAIYLTLTKGQAQLVQVVERHGQEKFLNSISQ